MPYSPFTYFLHTGDYLFHWNLTSTVNCFHRLTVLCLRTIKKFSGSLLSLKAVILNPFFLLFPSEEAYGLCPISF